MEKVTFSLPNFSFELSKFGSCHSFLISSSMYESNCNFLHCPPFVRIYYSVKNKWYRNVGLTPQDFIIIPSYRFAKNLGRLKMVEDASYSKFSPYAIWNVHQPKQETLIRILHLAV